MREPEKFDMALLEAETEAERFLKRVAEYKAFKKSDGYEWGYSGGPLRAAVKRASMDLTRALAKLRRSYM